MSVADEKIARLRTGFLLGAIRHVKELVASGEIDEATVAGVELREYFGWIEETIPPEERELLALEFEALPGKLQKLKPGDDSV